MKSEQSTSLCDSCRRRTSSYGFVRFGAESDSQDLCNRCFNQEAARRLGLEDEFQHVEFEPIELPDAQGELHEFHFRTHLYGEGVKLEGAELTDGVPEGYIFAVSGEPSEDPFVLFQRLLAKTRLGLQRTHVVEGDLGPALAPDDVVRGRITWDDETHGELPLLVVDGRPLSWNALGRILMSYEGFHFKLEIRDSTEA